ncbi:MAG TPA: beta-propeller domain-containing protein [Longimicrobium sp.]|nr:beta-propeller domain-containing protein [Longimicrobium sp.]
MRRLPLFCALLVSVVSLAACAGAGAGAGPPIILPPQQEDSTLTPFASEEELAEVNAELQAQLARMERIRRRGPPPPPPSPPAPPEESITNTQTEGVDEGGIVKVHGEHLVVLRRGRLFTVRIGGDALQPVAAVDAFEPGIDPGNSWYDEMLVSGDNVVVIGYSYARRGTELGIFRIGADGSLAHRATYHLRSFDYYSSRNYASRLIGGRLIFYAPIPVRRDLFSSLPGMRRVGGADGAWVRTATAQRIYRPAAELRLQDVPTLHSVTICDLAAADLRCESTALLGPYGREFYVSAGSVYLWTSAFARGGEDEGAMLYRMPLDGSAPTGLRVQGRPIDQFSFLESGDGHLNVLTRVERPIGQQAGREVRERGLALLRVPLSLLGDGRSAAPAELYRPLPNTQEPGALQNRYVGDWLLYGSGAGWGTPRPGETTAFAARWADSQLSELRLPHGVDRIEAMGPDAVVIGGDGEALHFTSVELGRTARTAARYTRPGASQGETRSHGFFYRPEGDDTGLLGLPIRGADRPGYEHLQRGSASILFLRNQALRLQELGELAADPEADGDDACRASCVDWYGNARPIFLRGRVFALMGYELVEGAMDDARIRERRRVSFAPRVEPRDFSGDWTFTETIGSQGGAYYCASEGSMRLDQDGSAVRMRYRQTSECTIEGATTRGDSEGTGRGTAHGHELRLEVETCRYNATFGAPHWISGALRCQVRLPGGAETVVVGRWSARRQSGTSD